MSSTPSQKIERSENMIAMAKSALKTATPGSNQEKRLKKTIQDNLKIIRKAKKALT